MIEHDHDHAGGQLCQEGGEAQGETGGRYPGPKPHPDQMEPLCLTAAVGRHDQETDDGGEARGQDGAEDPHPKGEDEYIVQDHIGQAPDDGGHHGAPGPSVIADIAEEDVVAYKGRREQEHDLQIGVGHPKHLVVRPHGPGERGGEKEADQDEQGGEGQTEVERLGEHDVRGPLVIPAPVDGKPGGAPHPQHEARAVDEIIDGDGDIEGGQTVCPQTLGHKEGVRQDVAGDGQHTQHAQGAILKKDTEGSCLFGHGNDLLFA